jgi:hypothetical protein
MNPHQQRKTHMCENRDQPLAFDVCYRVKRKRNETVSQSMHGIGVVKGVLRDCRGLKLTKAESHRRSMIDLPSLCLCVS